MKGKSFILLTITVWILASCATYAPQYREVDSAASYPSEKKIAKSFYLVGDAGKSPYGGFSDALATLQNLVKSRETTGDYAIYLGDNIYPDGLPPKGAPDRKYAEHQINAQIDALKEFGGEIVFIPGNHDWYNGGLSGLNREAEYIKEYSGKDMMKPSGGCPLESIEISDEIHLIAIDSQWYLEDWNKDPDFNEFCEIKSREKFFIELEIELKKYKDKTILFVMHHPMFTNGTHGGYYAAIKHLYPTQSKLPLPGLASLVAQIRAQGGVSVQDRYNELYNKLMNKLAAITRDNPRLVFASGHEHTMHHIEHDGMIQIQTGNGAKSSYGTIGEYGLFSYGGQGFAVMDVFEDGSSWVRYYAAPVDHQPTLLFEKELFPPKKTYDFRDALNIPRDQRTTKAAIYTQDSINEALFLKTVWGAKYKDVYAKQVTANIARLDSVFGGVEVVGEIGNENYRALKLKDRNGNSYRMRALKKNAFDYTKTIIAEDESSPADGAEDAEEAPTTYNSDFFTASHPYALMAIPKLADTLEIFHTNPQLYYVPKQKRLGGYNDAYGDELYYFSVEPTEDSRWQRSFEYPDDIETTDDILIKLRRRGDISVDEENYIKSRLFDMLIGDWDREPDHWSWAEYYNRDSLNVFVPIPKNRDDAFANFEGNILDVAKSIFGSNNQRHIYSEDLRNLEFFNKEGIILDRAILKRSGRKEWTKFASEIQQTLSDEVIDAAFEKVPVEAQNESLSEIKSILKKRRENLVDIADRYFTFLATLQTIEGSNFNDYFEITRLENGITNVKVYSNYKTERIAPVIDRDFSSDDTDELWIFGLDGQDTFEIKGEGTSTIYVRMIGGQGNDTFKLINGKGSKVYDHETKENTIEIQNGGSIRLTNVYDLNTYDYRKQINRTNSYEADFGFNPDDGFLVGAQYIYRVNSYQRNPFSQKHNGSVNYYFDTSSFDLEYKGEFANIQNDKNLSFGVYFSSPNYTVNYFGYGNETSNPEEELGFDFNRVEVQTISADVGLLKNSSFGSYFKVLTRFEAINVNSPIIAPLTPGGLARMDQTAYYGSLEGLYNYRSFDDAVNPSRGMMFDLRLGITDNIEDLSRLYGYLRTRLGFYNNLIPGERLVLKTNVAAQFNFDNKFEFYQAVKLGAKNGLRGFREERFAGKSSLVGSADLRYSFNKFKIELIPIKMGIYLGGDLGKIWIPGKVSDIWHTDYGGGLWLNGPGGLQGSFSTFTSTEGYRIQFGFGFSF